MLKLFKKEFVSPEEKKLAIEVERRGGKAALSNEKSMKELAHEEADPNTPLVLDNRRTGSRSLDPAKLREEIDETPDEAIKKNAELFSGKLELQMRHITEDIKRAVHREVDRAIEAVTAGPHDRIVDPV